MESKGVSQVFKLSIEGEIERGGISVREAKTNHDTQGELKFVSQRHGNFD